MTVELNEQNFQKEALDYQGVILVDFWAPWCGPCQVMGPIVEQLAKEMKGKAKIGRLNVDENQKIPNRYEIMSIPSLLIFKDGQLKEQLIGIHSGEELKEKINEQR